MLGRGKEMLDKNNDALTGLVKTGGCGCSISGQREKHKHGDTQDQAQEHPPKKLQLQENLLELEVNYMGKKNEGIKCFFCARTYKTNCLKKGLKISKPISYFLKVYNWH